MRLVLVISHLATGGAQRVLSIMANYWAEKGWHITVLTLDAGREPPFYDLHPAVTHHPLGLSAHSHTRLQGILNNLRRLWVLRQTIKKDTPQVVISFMDRPNVLTILAGLGLQVPVIISERIDPAHHPIGTEWGLLRQWTYPYCSCLVIQSDAALSYFPPNVRRRACVIPNPVMVPHGKSPSLRSECNKKVKTIMAMGRLCEQKGFDLLLEAFARVSPLHSELSLTVWGEGPLRPGLEQFRDELGLQGRVNFPGRTRHPFEKMRQADLFILSSRYEGFPNVLCEAMACGLPVISFDCPSGPREIITHGADGVLVPPEDVDALAAAIDRLMPSEEERKDLGVQARRITERFALNTVMGMWEGTIDKATQESAPDGRDNLLYDEDLRNSCASEESGGEVSAASIWSGNKNI